jgi:choline/glycine/proline betaine transport protein
MAPLPTWSRLTAKMQPTVFFGSALAVVAFIVLGAGFTDLAGRWFSTAQSWIVRTFGWYYVLAATGFLLFALWMMLGRYGRIRLGPDDSKPEFGRVGWFTMMFSAGMGTGLVFWGVAEPMLHFQSPLDAEPQSPEAIAEAMRLTFFHWGLHPWAIYIVLGLSLAYFHFRRGLPLAPRSVFYPLIGERIHGPIGHGVDILCTVGTLLGVATSLGLGAMQINQGLARVAPIGTGLTVQILIIAVITAIATASVVLGLKRGVRRLSELNMILAGTLFFFVLIAGPTVYLLETFVSGLGRYLETLPLYSLWIDLDRDAEWQGQWTLFYWGWWISWSPFVGVFVARISKGRTIREFVAGVLLVPTLVAFLWLAVFGGAGLNAQLFGDGGVAEAVDRDVALSLHAMLDTLPWSAITGVLATLVIVVFFITSSDSGSFVDDMVTSGGHPSPPRPQRVFWAVSEGAVAATLLIAGGLTAMQNAAIATGLPMSVLLVVACWSLARGLKRDRRGEALPATGEITTPDLGVQPIEGGLSLVRRLKGLVGRGGG